MNMKLIHRWLLALCFVIGSLISPTKGADLNWKEFCEINNSTYGMQWEFTLLDVPSRGHPGYAFKLYQQLPSGDWHRIPALWTSQTIFGSSVPTTVDIPFAITEHFFKKDPHNTHIVKAVVYYPDGKVLESRTVNLNALHLYIHTLKPYEPTFWMYFHALTPRWLW